MGDDLAGMACERGKQAILDWGEVNLIVAQTDLPPRKVDLEIVDHNGVRLEAFGKSGRLWKTTVISVGGFRRLGFTGYAILGEARHPKRPGWARFFVMLATGKGVMGGRG